MDDLVNFYSLYKTVHSVTYAAKLGAVTWRAVEPIGLKLVKFIYIIVLQTGVQWQKEREQNMQANITTFVL
jgi:hypothetical protein